MATTSGNSNTSVLIVGGGPVGLSLAIELCRWGIKPIVAEKRPADELIYPTANHLSVRGGEILRRWGLASRIRETGFDPNWDGGVGVFTHVGGHELRRYVKESNGDSYRPSYSPESEMWQPKRYVDPVLRQEALDLGVILHSPAQVTSIHQDDTGVTVQVKDLNTEQSEEIRADYVVGCDGANSLVRHSIGMELEGLPPEEPKIDSVYFRSTGLAGRIPARWQYRLLGNASGPHDSGWMLVAIDGNELWRLHGPGVVDLENAEQTKANLQSIAGFDTDIDIISMGSWQLRQALCPSFGKGRVFLAGDAAARGTTFGGLWMNRGMADALDLGWKLAASIQGWGGAKLLDSYTIERRDATLQLLLFQGADLSGPEPVKVLDRKFGHADAVVNPPPALWDDGEEGDTIRNAVREHFESNNANTFDFSAADVGYRYDGSPIIVDDGSELPEAQEGAYVQSSKPGGRAPHAWLPDGTSTLDWFNQHFTLVNLGEQDPHTLLEAARERGLPIEVKSSDDSQCRDLYQQSCTLVRPDGFVAWRGDMPDLETAYQIIDTLRGA
ncbi:hypothetical protein HBA55_18405 [Pseudomaricurvus alkylphenolicus]|uniref:FAD-dependent oxidoreductase n=1 Tax=Pseudomaricurvus alkylphenolicus TaxID=1306991 RepID=UPI00141E1FCB|nr:FAD-dependent oxidoreductase [Pseudomaricurvus alkylphenolicus]NIB41582.1 hypothetical protein [Pseudomaricurvus alkylphenolicus]